MVFLRLDDYDAMSKAACAYIIEKIKNKPNSVLGLATGSTVEGLYQNIIEKYQQSEVSFKDVSTFNLDEYVGLSISDRNSYHYFMKEKLFKHTDILMEKVQLLNGEAEDLSQECMDYESKIHDAGGIDIQVLGLGLNGHIGFNEPGTSFTSRTHVVELDETTRVANSRFFESLDAVPKKAITMGIETIMESKEIILLVSGIKKAKALQRLIEGEVSEDFPASILNTHRNVTVIADEEALEYVKVSI